MRKQKKKSGKKIPFGCFKRFLQSPEGQKALKEGMAVVKKAAEERRRAQRINYLDMHKPVTI